MNANELRVNQTYILPDGYHRLPSGVTTLSGGDLSVILDYGLEEEIVPIPLTEEILLAFGFEYDDIDGNSGYWKVNNFKVVFGEDGCSYNWSLIIKYVHQLQNLVFALTGEELTFKQEI
jgi:hypothetical protein